MEDKLWVVASEVDFVKDELGLGIRFFLGLSTENLPNWEGCESIFRIYGA